MRTRVLILSTADFSNPIWTNKQYIAQGLAVDCDVTYVESLGLRRPTFRLADLMRIARRISGTRSTVSAVREPDPAITIVAPNVIPFHSLRLVRWLNRRILRRTLRRNSPELKWDVLWTFSPLTYGLEDMVEKIVYHSVDLLHTFSGVPASLLLDAEDDLIRATNVIVCSSVGIREHLESKGATDVRVWENVASTELYARDLDSPRIDRAIFAGNLTPTKVNFSLMTDLADSGMTLAIAGSVGVDGTHGGTPLEQLLKHPRIDYLGTLAPEDLAREMNRSKAGLIPYEVNDHTNGIFPMKVYEYLAAGLPVISTPLRSLVGSSAAETVTLVQPADFVREVSRAVKSFDPALALERSKKAQSHSWAGRQASARALVQALAKG